MSHFSHKFKTLRKEHNLTQDKLAEYLGFSKSAVNMYERGEREPNFANLHKIADFFNVDMNSLIGTGDMLLEQKEYVRKLNITADEIKDTLNIFSKRVNGSSMPKTKLQQERLKEYFSFFANLTKMTKEDLQELIEYSNSLNEPIYINAAHEIVGSTEEDRLHDDKFFED